MYDMVISWVLGGFRGSAHSSQALHSLFMPGLVHRLFVAPVTSSAC